MTTRNFLQKTSTLAVIACFLWGTAFVVIKKGLQYTDPLQFAGIRFFLSGIVLLPFIRNLRANLQLAKKHYIIIITVGLLPTTLLYALFYIGMNQLPGALGALIIGSAPLFIALISHFTMPNDSLTIRKTLIILLGFLGVAIISFNKDSATTTGYPLLWIGVLLLLVSNVVGGFGNVIVAKYAKELPPLILSSLSLILGGALLLLIAVPIEGIHFESSLSYYLSLTWLIFLSSTAISIWFILLKRPNTKVSNLNVWKFIVPVFGACLSWIFLENESPNILSLIGMGLIALSLILLNARNRKEKTKNQL